MTEGYKACKNLVCYQLDILVWFMCFRNLSLLPQNPQLNFSECVFKVQQEDCKSFPNHPILFQSDLYVRQVWVVLFNINWTHDPPFLIASSWVLTMKCYFVVATWFHSTGFCLLSVLFEKVFPIASGCCQTSHELTLIHQSYLLYMNAFAQASGQK